MSARGDYMLKKIDQISKLHMNYGHAQKEALRNTIKKMKEADTIESYIV